MFLEPFHLINTDACVTGCLGSYTVNRQDKLTSEDRLHQTVGAELKTLSDAGGQRVSVLLQPLKRVISHLQHATHIVQSVVSDQSLT